MPNWGHLQDATVRSRGFGVWGLGRWVVSIRWGLGFLAPGSYKSSGDITYIYIYNMRFVLVSLQTDPPYNWFVCLNSIGEGGSLGGK